MTDQLPPERVQCRHPDPAKSGPRIDRWLYDVTRAAILDAAPLRGDGLPLSTLAGEVERRTPPGTWAAASVGWYTTVVKLDLEARGLLLRAATTGPQRLYRRQSVPARAASADLDPLVTVRASPGSLG
ncbi:MAG TPA: hypothetical protein VGD72_09185 [Mycobacteriales bacterium]|jgi:hypothetical protein